MYCRELAPQTLSSAACVEGPAQSQAAVQTTILQGILSRLQELASKCLQ